MDTSRLHSGNIDTMYNLEFKKFYKVNGKIEGEYSEYHNLRPDKIFIKCNFVNGEIHGKYYEFHTNDKIYTMCNYVNGKIEGPFRQYYSSGKQYRVCNYINNKIHGEFREYHKSNGDNNGQVKIVCNYNNGKKEGLFIRYYQSDESKLGPIEEIINYNDGKINGEYINYHKNGNVHMKCKYVNDKIIDTYYKYKDDGSIFSVYNFVDNKRTTMTQYENGKIKRSGVIIHPPLSERIYDSNYGSEYEMKDYDKDGNEIEYIIPPQAYVIVDGKVEIEESYKKNIHKINDFPMGGGLQMPALRRI